MKRFLFLRFFRKWCTSVEFLLLYFEYCSEMLVWLNRMIMILFYYFFLIFCCLLFTFLSVEYRCDDVKSYSRASNDFLFLHLAPSMNLIRLNKNVVWHRNFNQGEHGKILTQPISLLLIQFAAYLSPLNIHTVPKMNTYT